MKSVWSRITLMLGRKPGRDDPPPSEADLAKMDAAVLDDPSLTPSEKMAAAFMQFHRTSMREKRDEMAWKRRRNLALIIFAMAGTVTSVVYNSNRIMKSVIPKDHAAVVNIVGAIGEDPTATHGPINAALKEAFENPRVKRVILRIDSPGGTPNESEAIINEIARLKKQHNKPVDAVIENIGASAAYMIAVHADNLYAGRYSMVGSVGAVMQTWNLSKIIDRVDAENETFVSGKFKDLLNPYRSIRDEERVKVQSMVDSLASVFADEVILSRKGKIKLDRDALTTGEVWVGDDALRKGLIDGVATLADVAAKHGLEINNLGPVKPQGFFIPTASALFEEIGSAFARGLTGGSSRATIR
jgi:protease-4